MDMVTLPLLVVWRSFGRQTVILLTWREARKGKQSPKANQQPAAHPLSSAAPVDHQSILGVILHPTRQFGQRLANTARLVELTRQS
jgi:hypothetical protein